MLKLSIIEKILDKVLWLLGQFKNEDLQIIEFSSEFESNKKYLEKELSRLHSGEAKPYSMEETDEFLEKTIQQYEGYATRPLHPKIEQVIQWSCFS